MSTRTLNLGILAHVDAGKTSLTERLLFENGAISELGSVDGGNTTTDSGEIERQRGITIRSAVASFGIGDLQINLVDTPGHPDFIAEVERALSVLDAAVLVISAVEGVQAQTQVLFRSLKRLSLPTLLFVNKIDRMGARDDELIARIRRRLTPSVVAMQRVVSIGTREADVVPSLLTDEPFAAAVAEVLIDHDEKLLARMVEGDKPDPGELAQLLRDQTRAGAVHPLFFGSALSGVGTVELTEAIRQLLQPDHIEPVGPNRGTVFAVTRTRRGEKVAYLRLFSGEVHERQRLTFHRRNDQGSFEEYRARIAGLEVVGVHGSRPGPLTPGNIATLRGLPQIRVGDRIGEADGSRTASHFSPPILESIVRAVPAADETRLHAALVRLADEDPLIRTRTVPGGATSVLLYGAVQREVIVERLRTEFGIEALFEEVQPVYFERPAAVGRALWEFEPRGPNEFWQTLGIRVERAPTGTGNTFVQEAEWGVIPRAYHKAIEESARATLMQGLYGWEVTDCVVAITALGCEAPMTTAAEFRNLTPLVLMRALKEAGSIVYEPAYAFGVETPEDSLSGVMGLLLSLGATLEQPALAGSIWQISGQIPARSLHGLAAALPGLTHGEGTIWYEPGGDLGISGVIPTRERTDGNPLNHDEYMRYLSNRALADKAAGAKPR